jgi:hypothetical protein
MLAFSARNASIDPKYCRWAGRTFSTSATVGFTSFANGSISPGWFVPISSTAALAPRGVLESESGTPQKLFRLPVACGTTQRRIQKRTYGGFAAAPGHREHGPRETHAGRATERPQSIERIGHTQLRQPGSARMMSQCADRTAPLRLVDERVAVAVAAAVCVETRTRITEQRNEQIAGDQRARIDADSEYVGPIDRRRAHRDAGVTPAPNDFTEFPVHRRCTTIPAIK